MRSSVRHYSIIHNCSSSWLQHKLNSSCTDMNTRLQKQSESESTLVTNKCWPVLDGRLTAYVNFVHFFLMWKKCIFKILFHVSLTPKTSTVSCILKCRGYFQSESPLILNFIQLFFLKQSSSGVEKSLFTTSPARTLMQVRSNLPRPTVFIQVKRGWRYKWQTTWLPSVSNRCFNPNVQQSSMRLIDKSKDTRKYEGQK